MSGKEEVASKLNFWQKVSDASKETKGGGEPTRRTAISADHLKEKYLQNVDKCENSARYRRVYQDGPNKAVLKEKATFWESASDSSGKNASIYPHELKRSAMLTDVNGKKNFWSNMSEEKVWEAKQTERNHQKVSGHRWHKRVTDMTQMWHQIVQQEDDGKGQSNHFLSTTSHTYPVNVNKMTGKYNMKISEEEDNKGMERPSLNFEKAKGKEQDWMDATESQKTTIISSNMSVTKSNRPTDVELVCQAIHNHGEQYTDGTAAISISIVTTVFGGINLMGALAKAKKFGLIDYDGDNCYTLRGDDVIVLLVPIGEVEKAFRDMRETHPEIFNSTDV